MSNVIEVEQKFFCQNIDNLIKKLILLEFIKQDMIQEIDEYFTDINSIFIQNRTCLRIRKTNNKNLELTFKGKSNDFTGNYAKLENNIPLEINSYTNIKDMLFALGYYSYSIVDKDRIIYSKTINNLQYNIMIDNIKYIGSFVEFEILSKNDENIDILKLKLNDFILMFNNIKFEEANLPYRDFVAEQIFNNFFNKNINNITNINIILNKNNKNLNLNLELINQLKQKNININIIENNNDILDNNNYILINELDNTINNISNSYNYEISKILFYLINFIK